MCWYCHWGVAEPVAEIYKEALARLGGDESLLLYGPAHIVWSDFNFEREHVQWCLDHFYAEDYLSDMEPVYWSLKELLKLPHEVLSPEPDNDGDIDYALLPPKIMTVKLS